MIALLVFVIMFATCVLARRAAFHSGVLAAHRVLAAERAEVERLLDDANVIARGIAVEHARVVAAKADILLDHMDRGDSERIGRA